VVVDQKRFNRLTIVAWTTAVPLFAGAIWFSVGPWNVSAPGGSFGCGSPLMGRYRATGDAAAPDWPCHLQAPLRLHLAVAFWAAAFILLAVGVMGQVLAHRNFGRRNY
jgi:hypothetical protein